MPTESLRFVTPSEMQLELEQAAARVQAMHDAAREVRPDIIVLCHGGPIAEPADAEEVLRRAQGVAGFFGASSIERLATEPAIEEQARRFRAITLRAPVRATR